MTYNIVCKKIICAVLSFCIISINIIQCVYASVSSVDYIKPAEYEHNITVDRSQNNTPILNINKANSDGVSKNDFIDYNVIDEKGVILGKIVDVDVSTENALFIVVKPNGNEFYIPIADEFIIDINVDTLTIQMDLPLGLIEIN